MRAPAAGRSDKMLRSGRPRRATANQPFSEDDGFIPGTQKDPQRVRADWLPAQSLLQGVKVMEVRNVTKGRGLLTEIFRADWKIDDAPVDQVFQVVLGPGEISAWHVHRDTRDRFFVNHGSVRIVLYDARRASKTYRGINEFFFGSHRPALLLVPPGVWHGIQNMREEDSLVLNMVDRAYSYEDPDHWRLPRDSPRIPYTFDAGGARRR